MSLKEHKLKLKPWITKGILTSINNKNKTYRKYCRAKDQNRKHELHTLFKQYLDLDFNSSIFNLGAQYFVLLEKRFCAFMVHDTSMHQIVGALTSLFLLSKIEPSPLHITFSKFSVISTYFLFPYCLQ